MRAKPAILLASAITLIIIGAFFSRQAASPMRESTADAEPTAGRESVIASPRLFSLPRPRARLSRPSQDDPESVRPLAEIAIAWANQDLPSAVEWARQLPDQTERQKAMLCIGFETARAEPLTALALALELNADPDRDELIRHAAGEWAARAPDAAAEWARQIEDPSLRTRTLASIATAWAEIDPRAAAALATDELELGRLQEDTLVSIVQRWTQQQPTDAAAWVSTFEEGDLRAAAVHNLVKLWADQNPTATGEWLNSLLPGSLRNLAIAAYVEQIAPAFPNLASQWADFARLDSQ